MASLRPDWVFHLAAHGGYSWQNEKDEIVRTNVLAAACLVRACTDAGIGALVSAGSSSEYGYKDHAPSEDDVLEPNSDYAVAKAFASQLLRMAARRDGLPAITLRLYSVYGPWEEPARFLPTLISRASRGELPPLVDPSTARDFVHVDDVCEAFVRAASFAGSRPGAIFNTGTGVQTTIRDAVEVARRVFGLEVEPNWGTMPRRAWDTRTWVADNRRIREALGWEPTILFEDGFRQMAAWTGERDNAGRPAPGRPIGFSSRSE